MLHSEFSKSQVIIDFSPLHIIFYIKIPEPFHVTAFFALSEYDMMIELKSLLCFA